MSDTEKDIVERLEVQTIEMVRQNGIHSEDAEPTYRVEVDGICFDFDDRGSAERLAATITTLRAEVVQFQRSTVEWYDNAKEAEVRADKAEAALAKVRETWRQNRRDIAVGIVDGVHGYTVEFSAYPREHERQYDAAEEIINFLLPNFLTEGEPT